MIYDEHGDRSRRRHFLYYIFRRDRAEHPMAESAREVIRKILAAAAKTKENAAWNGKN